ncbi:MAG: DUF4268 domain-containing protein [Gammaproteobacteria bacterium]|nr:DUF4268 domain-containing protein [Gammaproteobacteria bacterium]
MASQIDFGEVREMDVRTGWESEDGSFTPWLADNIELLENALEIEIDKDSIDTEVSVGDYRADIRCQESADDTVVLVENQLEKTDHRHLGQLLTYASGLAAFKVVWIAQTFSDEHSATLDWLNRVTPTEYAFFGLEIKLWQIDDSKLAPKLEIISKPNDWQRSSSISRDLSPTKQAYLAYWRLFKERLHDNQSVIQARAPKPQNWMFFALGRGGFELQGTVKQNGADVSVNIPIEYFDAFAAKRDEYEELLDCSLRISRGERSYSRLILDREFQILERDQWESCMEWMQDYLEKFHTVFRDKIKSAQPNTVAVDQLTA